MLGAAVIGWLWFAIFIAAAPPAAAASYPSPAEADAVCRHIVARGPAITSELVKSGVLDANNDGQADDVTVGMGQGTMAGDNLEFRSRGAPTGSAAIEYETEGFEWKDYWSFGRRWLPFGNRVYTLNFSTEDMRHPTYLGFIDADNKEQIVCDFEAAERETLKPARRKYTALCARVARGKVAFIVATTVNDDEYLPTERRNTGLRARVTADVRNIGRPQSLALLGFSFSGGRGCDFEYFDALDNDHLASSGATHDVLLKLQNVDLGDHGPYVGTTCRGNSPRWFSDGGKIYFDNTARDAGRRTGPSHEVKLIQDMRVDTICAGGFTPVWRLKTIGPKFR